MEKLQELEILSKSSLLCATFANLRVPYEEWVPRPSQTSHQYLKIQKTLYLPVPLHLAHFGTVAPPTITFRHKEGFSF